MFVKKTNRNSHVFFVIARNRIRKWNFDCVIVIVFLITIFAYFFMLAKL